VRPPCWAPGALEGLPAETRDAVVHALPAYVQRTVGEWRSSNECFSVLPGNVPDTFKHPPVAMRAAAPPGAVVLPPIVVAGIGARDVLRGDDQLIDAPILHESRFSLSSLGLSAAQVPDLGPALGGFFLRSIAWKVAGAASEDHPLRAWTRQGTHLRNLTVEPGAPYVDGEDLVLPLAFGLIGGHAAEADVAQRWKGAHGYVGALRVVLVPAETATPVQIELPKQVGASYGYRKLGREDVVLSGFSLDVETFGPTPDAPDMGRLIRELGVGVQRLPGEPGRTGGARFFAGFSNHGAWALAHRVTARGTLLVLGEADERAV
jgi:hypothetical protein